MPKTNFTITSREYKLMLNPLCFRDQDANVAEFRLLIRHLATQVGATIVAEQDKDDPETRTTWYLDTPLNALRRHGCCLRVRDEDQKKVTKITLKFRNGDRYIAAARDVQAVPANAKETKQKFEEDILPTVSKFSHSCSAEFADKPPKLEFVDDAARLFPGLGDLNLAKDSPLV